VSIANRPDAGNIARRHGCWGEEEAVRFLLRKGYRILDRNARPSKRDMRLEIDIVAYDPKNETVVFVEVKQHSARSLYQRRLRSVDKRKKANLLRVCRAWLHRKSWPGAYRFDVVEVYGSPGETIDIDHVQRVELFARRERFVKWN
jgi:putative endonuclease